MHGQSYVTRFGTNCHTRHARDTGRLLLDLSEICDLKVATKWTQHCHNTFYTRVIRFVLFTYERKRGKTRKIKERTLKLRALELNSDTWSLKYDVSVSNLHLFLLYILVLYIYDQCLLRRVVSSTSTILLLSSCRAEDESRVRMSVGMCREQ